ELRAAGLVGGDHLTIEYRLVDAKLGHDVVTEGRGDLLAQRIEPGEDIPSSRDKAAAPVLDIAHRAKPIVFRIEQPVEMVERVLAPGRGDRLYPRKCHCPRAYWRDPADFPRAALDDAAISPSPSCSKERTSLSIATDRGLNSLSRLRTDIAVPRI